MLRISKEIDHKVAHGIALSNMENAYLELQQYNKAKECYHSALQHAEAEKDSEGQVLAHANITN
jgi:hypothetical protein